MKKILKEFIKLKKDEIKWWWINIDWADIFAPVALIIFSASILLLTGHLFMIILFPFNYYGILQTLSLGFALILLILITYIIVRYIIIAPIKWLYSNWQLAKKNVYFKESKIDKLKNEK